VRGVDKKAAYNLLLVDNLVTTWKNILFFNGLLGGNLHSHGVFPWRNRSSKAGYRDIFWHTYC
jgi:hypothetical protein